MNIDSDLNAQINVAEWIDENLSIPYLFDNENERWSHTCFDLAVEHHAAVISLCKQSLYGSALSLLRIEFEALVRGLWLRHVASENEIKKFKKDKVDPRFYKLIEAIEGKVGIKEGLLSYIKDNQWNIFNSFTHTGIEAVSRRIGKKTTGYENYQQTDVVNALRFSGLVAVLAAVELASISKKQEVVDSAMAFANDYGK